MRTFPKYRNQAAIKMKSHVSHETAWVQAASSGISLRQAFVFGLPHATPLLFASCRISLSNTGLRRGCPGVFRRMSDMSNISNMPSLIFAYAIIVYVVYAIFVVASSALYI